MTKNHGGIWAPRDDASLIRHIHEIAAVAGLDDDDVGYLLGEVEKIKVHVN